MSNGPIKAEDISDELHDKIMQLLLRKALGKQGMADILNAAIYEVLGTAIATGLVERPKRCGDCKHLGEPLTRYDWADLKDVPTKYRTCNRIEMAPDAYEIDSRTDLALAKDGSGYMASLLTLESFGCNLWEAKGEGE